MINSGSMMLIIGAIVGAGIFGFGYAMGVLITNSKWKNWQTVGRGVGNFVMAMAPGIRTDLPNEVDIVIRHNTGKKDSFLVYTDEEGAQALTNLLLERVP